MVLQHFHTSLYAKKEFFKKVLTFLNSPCKITYVVTQGYTLQAQIAQLVEQRTENPRVTGSIPVLGIEKRINRQHMRV